MVRGVWNETVDSMGDNTGIDVLRLHDSKGTFLVAFNNENPGRPHAAGHRAIYYQDPQRVYDPTGAFGGDSESGSIELVTNHSQTLVASLRLQTQKT
jgi:hypothetical protein